MSQNVTMMMMMMIIQGKMDRPGKQHKHMNTCTPGLEESLQPDKQVTDTLVPLDNSAHMLDTTEQE